MHQTKHLRRMTALMVALILMLLSTAALAADGVVNTKSLVLRKSASKSSKALQTLDRGDKLEIHSSTGDWYKVTYGRYTGYVMKKYVKVNGKVEETTSNKQETTTGSTATPGDAPAASRPGDTGSHVKTLQQALQKTGHYKGKIDGIYGKQTTAAVKAFQRKHGLTRDGIAGKVTIRTLFGSNADTLVTQSLKWFGNENVIPRGATVTIKDCLTGKTFQAVRWAGSSHMDTEPANKEAAATIKEIYGGSYSWKRRAILVKYNGQVYAASMNGMPHGTSTISNGFDGHFCVHFTGSQTHETNKVDSDHQDCVKTALKYTW